MRRAWVGFVLLLWSGCQPSSQLFSITTLSPSFLAPPKWAVGDQYVYDDGYGLEVVAQSGEITKFRRLDDPQQWMTMQGFFDLERQSSTQYRKVLSRKGPFDPTQGLPIGQSLQLDRQLLSGSNRHQHQEQWVVDGREQLTTPAGTFDCWRITRNWQNHLTLWHGFERFWWSEDIGFYVKLEYRYGNQPEGRRLLIKFTKTDAVDKR